MLEYLSSIVSVVASHNHNQIHSVNHVIMSHAHGGISPMNDLGE